MGRRRDDGWDYWGEEPWGLWPTIDVHDGPLMEAIGFVRFGSAARSANSHPANARKTPDMPDVAPIYNREARERELAEDEFDLSYLLSGLWRVAAAAEDLDGGELQNALIASGIASVGTADEDDAAQNDLVEVGAMILRLTPLGARLLKGVVLTLPLPPRKPH
jgi:hypothetical protein